MRAVRLWFILILGGATAVMCGSIGGHANSSGIGPESETLYLEKDPSTGRYLDSHALLYFKPELRTGAPADWNLRYGMLAINDEDW
ncbi:MAG TPA: hypothetical protein VEZ90_06630, partial [Blastocatellia bacterium]|nr:hypothetical protein [Blastocatellia bacterium]